MMRSTRTSLLRSRARGRASTCALALLAGCTLTTDAGDRVIAERLDLDFTLFAMNPHRGSQLDVALVHPVDPSLPIPLSTAPEDPKRQYQLRARARILVPAEESESLFPPITVPLPGVITNEPLQVLFYVDTQLNNMVEPLTPEGKPLEHTWVKPVPENGELSFTHQFDFQAYYDSWIIGSSDIVLDVPTGVSAAATACLNQQVTTLAKKTIDVRIVFNAPDSPRVVGYFKMYATNTLPTLPIKLAGIADDQSVYLISPAIDGVPTRSSQSAAATATGLVIPFDQWFPIDPVVLAGCLAM
jgi:hypothetical protein